jgi:hypothetical protein
VDTSFLDRRATQLKIGKDAVCRRAIQRLLELVKEDYEAGRYSSTTEAENDFRKLAKRDTNCQ